MPSTAKVTDGRPKKSFYLGDPLVEPPPPELMALLDGFRGRNDALVSLLQELQEALGYLPERALKHASRELGVPLARLYGVATFYNQFSFTPPGKVRLQVCRGTPCHVAGAPAIVEELKTRLGISENQTTTDGMFTLQTVFCVGCCSLAPVVVANQEVTGKMSPERIPGLLDKCRSRYSEVSR